MRGPGGRRDLYLSIGRRQGDLRVHPNLPLGPAEPVLTTASALERSNLLKRRKRGSRGGGRRESHRRGSDHRHRHGRGGRGPSRRGRGVCGVGRTPTVKSCEVTEAGGGYELHSLPPAPTRSDSRATEGVRSTTVLLPGRAVLDGPPSLGDGGGDHSRDRRHLAKGATDPRSRHRRGGRHAARRHRGLPVHHHPTRCSALHRSDGAGAYAFLGLSPAPTRSDSTLSSRNRRQRGWPAESTASCRSITPGPRPALCRDDLGVRARRRRKVSTPLSQPAVPPPPPVAPVVDQPDHPARADDRRTKA